ncbi:MAG: hypothetical protein MHMPM18_000937 [Marteilia pararefringens]
MEPANSNSVTLTTTTTTSSSNNSTNVSSKSSTSPSGQCTTHKNLVVAAAAAAAVSNSPECDTVQPTGSGEALDSDGGGATSKITATASNSAASVHKQSCGTSAGDREADQAAPDYILEEAALLFTGRKYLQSLDICQEILVKYPNDMSTMLLISSINFEIQQYSKCVECCQNILDIEPACVEAIFNMAMAFLKSKEYDSAFKTFDKLIDNRFLTNSLILQASKVLIYQKEFDRALKLLSEINEDDSPVANLCMEYKLVTHFIKNDYKSIMIMQTNKNFLNASFSSKIIFGCIQAIMGQFEFAELYFKGCVELLEGTEHLARLALINYINTLIENEKHDEAFQKIMASLKSESCTHLSLCNLGYLMLKNKDEKIAMKYYKKALSFYPNYYDALNNIAYILIKNKKYTYASKVCNNLFDQYERHSNNLLNLLLISMKTNKLHKISSICKYLSSNDYTNLNIRKIMLATNILCGQQEQAKEDLKHILQSYPALKLSLLEFFSHCSGTSLLPYKLQIIDILDCEARLPFSAFLLQSPYIGSSSRTLAEFKFVNFLSRLNKVHIMNYSLFLKFYCLELDCIDEKFIDEVQYLSNRLSSNLFYPMPKLFDVIAWNTRIIECLSSKSTKDSPEYSHNYNEDNSYYNFINHVLKVKKLLVIFDSSTCSFVKFIVDLFRMLEIEIVLVFLNEQAMKQNLKNEGENEKSFFKDFYDQIVWNWNANLLDFNEFKAICGISIDSTFIICRQQYSNLQIRYPTLFDASSKCFLWTPLVYKIQNFEMNNRRSVPVIDYHQNILPDLRKFKIIRYQFNSIQEIGILWGKSDIQAPISSCSALDIKEFINSERLYVGSINGLKNLSFLEDLNVTILKRSQFKLPSYVQIFASFSKYFEYSKVFLDSIAKIITCKSDIDSHLILDDPNDIDIKKNILKQLSLRDVKLSRVHFKDSTQEVLNFCNVYIVNPTARSDIIFQYKSLDNSIPVLYHNIDSVFSDIFQKCQNLFSSELTFRFSHLDLANDAVENAMKVIINSEAYEKSIKDYDDKNIFIFLEQILSHSISDLNFI